MGELFQGVYRPKGDGGEIVIRRSEVDEAGIHPAVEILRFDTPGFFGWDHVAPAVAGHGFEVTSNRPVGHGERFFFDFHLSRRDDGR